MVTFKNYIDIKLDQKQQDSIDETFNSLKKEKDTNDVGYYKLYDTSKDILKQLKVYKQNSKLFQNNKIKDIAIIGIGGSSLGTKAIYELLKLKQKSKMNLHFLENVDPLEIEQTTKKLKKSTTLFILISKSGTTIETISIFKYVMKEFKLDLKKDSNRLIAITDNDSNLSKLAIKNNIPQFNIPSNVGGRFSVLSAVGVVPLYLAGYNVKKLLLGSKELIESFFQRKEEHILQKAYFYSQNKDKYDINTLFSYCSYLSYFNDWYVQLWGESLGKLDNNKNKVGLTPIGLVGSIDQHSFLQLIIQGGENKTVTFIKVDDFGKDIKIPNMKLEYLEKTDFINGHNFISLINESANATLDTLVDVDVPVDLIRLDKIDAKNIGTLITYYELLTSAVGIIFNINTYDQPAVEFGKQRLVKKFS